MQGGRRSRHGLGAKVLDIGQGESGMLIVALPSGRRLRIPSAARGDFDARIQRPAIESARTAQEASRDHRARVLPAASGGDDLGTPSFTIATSRPGR